MSAREHPATTAEAPDGATGRAGRVGRAFSLDRVLRYWVPGLVFVAVAAVLVVSPDIVGLEAGGILFGGGAAVVVVNEIQKRGFAGDVDRDKEEEAREFFRRYGIWPGQASDGVIAEARDAGLLQHVRVRRADGSVV